MCVKKQDNYNKFKTWEGLFIDVEDNVKNNMAKGNIYRPSKGNNSHRAIDSFLEEFVPIIDNVDNQCNNLILAGDFIIDLLKVSNNENINSSMISLLDIICCLTFYYLPGFPNEMPL